jgi:hypothetical protein
VNTRIALYTKKGELYEESGIPIFGPLGTNVIFTGFGGECERAPNGDAVVRYDQLAGRWLIVMPLFRRAVRPAGEEPGPYGMCYAVSAGPNPLGAYHRYYFERELFPDYPRPAVWPDGYYVPTSTGDNRLPDGSLPHKHACVLDRDRVLQGLPATEQCVIIRYANFLNNADIDGWGLPPAGAPNIVMATGGAQLDGVFTDDGIYYWKFYVDWDEPSNTRLVGPQKIEVAPYHFLCDGQLTRCVPQPGTEMRLDSQGDKIMQRLVYRNLDGRESILAVHSVNTTAGGGGVRWYEFRLDEQREPVLHQQGTYAPDEHYRWMASPAMDRQGNIGIGYSFGSARHYPGQRFAGRLADDPPGVLTFEETILVNGGASQTSTLRWQDYVQTAMDPDDDCTIWYVGDYLKEGAPSYTARIGAFRMPDCLRGTLSGASYFDVNRNGTREPNEPALPGWTIAYTGTRTAGSRLAPPAHTLRTDTGGEYLVTLPADPAYFDPTYTVTAASPRNVAWTRSESGTGYWSGGAVPMNDGKYEVRLRDREEVTHLSFGFACAVTNSGGAASSYWAGAEGAVVLRANEPQPASAGSPRGVPGWRGVVNGTHHLVKGDGTRLAVSGTFEEAHAELAHWLQEAAGSDAAQAASQQLATAALNVAYGSQDGSATVRDPLAGDWPSIAELLRRASAAIASGVAAPGARSTLVAYTALLEGLNTNRATVTPSSPARCPDPFGG